MRARRCRCTTAFSGAAMLGWPPTKTSPSQAHKQPHWNAKLESISWHECGWVWMRRSLARARSQAGASSRLERITRLGHARAPALLDLAALKPLTHHPPPDHSKTYNFFIHSHHAHWLLMRLSCPAAAPPRQADLAAAAARASSFGSLPRPVQPSGRLAAVPDRCLTISRATMTGECAIRLVPGDAYRGRALVRRARRWRSGAAASPPPPRAHHRDSDPPSVCSKPPCNARKRHITQTTPTPSSRRAATPRGRGTS